MDDRDVCSPLDGMVDYDNPECRKCFEHHVRVCEIFAMKLGRLTHDEVREMSSHRAIDHRITQREEYRRDDF